MADVYFSRRGVQCVRDRRTLLSFCDPNFANYQHLSVHSPGTLVMDICSRTALDVISAGTTDPSILAILVRNQSEAYITASSVPERLARNSCSGISSRNEVHFANVIAHIKRQAKSEERVWYKDLDVSKYK